MGLAIKAVRRLAPGLLLPLLLLATAFLYWPGLGGPLVLDDLTNLEVLTAYEAGRASAWDVVTGYGEGPWRRPLARASFLADQVLHGASVPALKHTNLMIHLLCGVLVFWLAGLLLGGPKPGTGGWWLALWVAAAWLTAPLLVSTVLYTVQRMAQLAALFVLAGLVLYARGRDRLASRPGRGWLQVGAAFVLCWPLAALSKENGILLPVLVLVVEVFFLRAVPAGGQGRRLRVLLATAAAIPVVIGLGYLLTHWAWLEAGYQARDFGPWQRLLTEAGILVDYAAHLLWLPGTSPLGLYRDDYPLHAAPLAPPFPLLLAAAWVAALVLAWRLRGTAVGPALGGLTFFVAAHLVESTILPLELYFEHRNYLPAVGLYLGLAALARLLLPLLGRLRGVVPVALTMLVALNGVMTATRVDVWRSKEALLDYHLQTHPGSVRVQAAAANLLLARGSTTAALERVDAAARAARGSRDATGALFHRLALWCHDNRAIRPAHWSAATPVADAPYTMNALGWLIAAVEAGHCPDFPAAALRRHLATVTTIRDAGRRWDLTLFKARLALAAGDTATAADHFLEAHAQRPGRPEVALRAAALLLASDEHERAGGLLNKLAPAAPTWAPAAREAFHRLQGQLSR